MMKQTKLLFFVHHLYAVDGKKQIALTEGDDLLSVDDAVRPLTHRLKAAVATLYRYVPGMLGSIFKLFVGAECRSNGLEGTPPSSREIQIYAKNRR